MFHKDLATAPKKESRPLLKIFLLCSMFIGLPYCAVGGLIVWFEVVATQLAVREELTLEASNHPLLSARLGESYQARGWFKVNITGSYLTSHGATADITYSGPNGNAVVRAELDEGAYIGCGSWSVTSMIATFDDGSTADLLEDA